MLCSVCLSHLVVNVLCVQVLRLGLVLSGQVYMGQAYTISKHKCEYFSKMFDHNVSLPSHLAPLYGRLLCVQPARSFVLGWSGMTLTFKIEPSLR